MEQKELVREFIDSQSLMVISSVSEKGTPQSALVGFAIAPDMSLVFGTSTTTRKFKNIEKNNTVAIVFGNREKITIQYEGVATVLEGNELSNYKEIYFQKAPFAKKFESDPHQVYLKVTPNWIRYTDYNKNPFEIFEITL